MADEKRALRFLRYYQMLLTNTIYRDRAMKEFNISKKSFERDVKDLTNYFGIEIYHDYGEEWYCLSPETHNSLKKNLLNSPSSNDFDESKKVFVHKILSNIAIFEKNEKHSLVELSKLLDIIHISKFPVARSKSDMALFSNILKNIIINNSITFKYYTNEKSKVYDVIGIPILLHFFNNKWYLIMEDDRRQIKTYNLDKIRKVRTHNATLVNKNKTKMEQKKARRLALRKQVINELDKRGDSIYFNLNEASLQNVTLTFNEVVARYFEESDYGFNQINNPKRNSNNSLTVHFKFSSKYEFWFFVNSWLGYIEVMDAPKEYIAEVKWRVKQMQSVIDG